MFPIAPGIVIINLILVAIVGMMIGTLAGFLISLTFRLGRKGLWKDAALGGVGILVGLFAAFTLPWPENTITTRLEGGGIMQETTRHFPYPFLVAYVLAAMLPIARHVYRFKRSRSSPS